MAKKILVVDDEQLIVKGLSYSLKQDGMQVDAAYDGEEAIALARKGNYDLILLDVMLPKADGFEVLRNIREFSDVPVIMLTARGEDIDRITGFEYGADDYIAKPFNITEVKARMKAVMRRCDEKNKNNDDGSEVTRTGNVRIDRVSRRVFIGDSELDLTAKEFDLFELLASHPDKVYSRKELVDLIWRGDKAGDLRTVDVLVRRLREKIEKLPGAPKYVFTKWGIGYYFRVTDAD